MATHVAPLMLSRRAIAAGLAAIPFCRSARAAGAGGMDAKTEQRLKSALAGDYRSAANKARDQYRHPLETLRFFGLTQDMAVLEVSPGAGWYTEILAPVLKDTGRYVATIADAEASENAAKNIATFKAKLGNAATYGAVQYGVLSLATGKTAPVPPGSMDMVLTFRNIHNWMATGTVDAMFKVFHAALKPGGWLGVVEHRAATSAPQDAKAASGYVREDYAIALAERAGFGFVAKSEVNANARDTKDYPKGVWTLPPTYAEGEASREKYAAIGESDRSTLLFQKAI
jgi:predicted methyltransferase